ncbi:MAG: PHP domain-containing protein [bacterium]|nr:PHP domain-containing protein [bacterium]
MGIDLHIHTIFSDGTLSPYETVEMAKEKGIDGLAITDHDEIGGVKEGLEAGEKFGVKVVPGAEFSAKYNEKTLHILGYFVDYENPKLIEFVAQMKEARLSRTIKIIDKLAEQGLYITLADVQENAGIGGIGRPHIATALINKGFIKDAHTAFNLYLGDGKPCHISKSNIGPEVIIQLIKEAKGVPVLAHPNLNKMDVYIPELVEMGMRGVEVWTPSQSQKEVKRYLEIVKKYNLIATGGSDSHGTRPGYPQIGEFSLPYIDMIGELEKEKNLNI